MLKINKIFLIFLNKIRNNKLSLQTLKNKKL